MGISTSRQTLRLTASLSPVSTLTETPCSRRARMAGAALFLGRVEEGDIAAQDELRLVFLE